MDWEPERDEKGNILGLEIEFFDEDPDGDEDRAGEGYYYRIAGDSEWSGAWHSTEEAEDEAIEELGDRRDSVAYVLAIHRRTGWPLAGLWSDPSHVGTLTGKDTIPTNVFCMTPDGHAMDITGTYYPSYLTNRWGNCRVVTYASEFGWRAAVGYVPVASNLVPTDEEVAAVEERIAGNAVLMDRLSSFGNLPAGPGAP
jgi:hypothetical protein